jgi:heme/copper-type cytochrome/quinol oxidase subunit 2
MIFTLLFPYLAISGEPTLITIHDHQFSPKEIHLPANQRFDITVKNEDTSLEEFESPGLKVEKVVPAGATLVIHVKPISPGRYTFVGEYHEKTARGLAVVE